MNEAEFRKKRQIPEYSSPEKTVGGSLDLNTHTDLKARKQSAPNKKKKKKKKKKKNTPEPLSSLSGHSEAAKRHTFGDSKVNEDVGEKIPTG